MALKKVSEYKEEIELIPPIKVSYEYYCEHVLGYNPSWLLSKKWITRKEFEKLI